jgi:uncharacterized protein YjiS (DUF1127 family)
MIRKIIAIVAANLAERSTIRELNRLSDRELNDIGISRWDIPNIARQEANAKFSEFFSYKTPVRANGVTHA